jgi:hypothetical protein
MHLLREILYSSTYIRSVFKGFLTDWNFDVQITIKQQSTDTVTSDAQSTEKYYLLS